MHKVTRTRPSRVLLHGQANSVLCRHPKSVQQLGRDKKQLHTVCVVSIGKTLQKQQITVVVYTLLQLYCRCCWLHFFLQIHLELLPTFIDILHPHSTERICTA